MKKVLAIVLCLGFASYAAAEIDFDRVVDMEEAMKNSSDSYNIPDVKWRGNTRFTEECMNFLVSPTDKKEIVSKKESFSSTEYIQECYTDYVFDTGTNCSEVIGQTWHLKSQLIVKPRQLYPWEKETIAICIKGPDLNLRVIESPYKYRVDRVEGGGETIFIVTPQWREATKPDKNGLVIVDFAYNKETKKYVLKLKDIWAKEYAGEKIRIKAEFKKDAFLWPDSTKEDKILEFEVSDNYEISFDGNGVEKGYIIWGFQRDGKISTKDYTHKGETSRVAGH